MNDKTTSHHNTALCLRFNVEMFAQFLYDVFGAAVMEVQCGERCAALEYEDQI